VQADLGDLAVDVDELRPGQRLLQGEEVEDPHALAFYTDPCTLAQLRQGLARGHEGPHVARLVAPREHLAGESDGREGAHLEMRNDGDGFPACRHDHRKGTFHLVEVLAEDAPEIGAGNNDHGIEPGAGNDRQEGIKHQIARSCRKGFHQLFAKVARTATSLCMSRKAPAIP